MADNIYSIPFETGLNEVSSDLRAVAGDVRRSLNYAVQAEGGYEWIGTMAQWSGRDVTLNLSSLDIIEVQSPIEVPASFTQTSEYGVKASYVGHIVRNSTTLVIMEKQRSTQRYTVGEYWVEQGSNTRSIISTEPDLTDSEWSQAHAIVSEYPANKSSTPPGDGDILLIHECGGTLFTVRMSGQDDAIVSRAVVGGEGGWIQVGVIPIPVKRDAMRWEAYSYQFAGQFPKLFIVSGVTPPYVAERREGFIDPPLATINDSVATSPTHVIVHQEHLFFAYPGGRILHSAIGDPTSFTVLGGASEIGAGGDITGFQILPGDSLGVFCKERIRVLQGTSSADWVLSDYSDEAGAIAGTLQNMPTSIFCDRRGISTLAASDTYGNFRDKTLTQAVDVTYQSIIRNAVLHSAVSRSKSQYRLLNEDGRGLYLTFNGSTLVGAMEVDFERPITAMGVLQGDEDQVFVGSGGSVMLLDFPMALGKSEAFLELVDHHYGSPRDKKQFSQVNLDVVGDPRVGLRVTTLIDGGQDYYADNEPVDIDVIKRSSPQYRNDLLSQFRQRFEGTAYLCGSGVSQIIRIENNASLPHSIKSATVHYRKRGQKR